MPNLFSEAVAFFESLAGSNPAAQQAANDVKVAANSIEATIEPLADDLLNVVLERIPLVGGMLTGPADALLNSFLDKLLAKFPTATALAPIAAAKVAPAVAPAPPATMDPIPNP